MRMQEVARARGFGVLLPHLENAIAHDRKTRTLEIEWEQAKTQKVGQKAVLIELELDRAVGGLYDVLHVFAAGPPAAPFTKPARALRDALFPNGTAPFTQAAFEQEASAVGELLRRLDGEQAAALTTLGLVPYRDQLRALHADFEAALLEAKPKGVTFDTVRAENARGQQLLLETVARVLGAYPSDSAADVQARAALLAPIAEQNEDVRGQRQRRRTASDLDPETGKPVPEVANPAATGS
jgi:hypothetical protein